MKKLTSLLCIVLMLLTLASCSPAVTYIKAPAENDSELFYEMIEINVEGDGEVIVYSYQAIYDVSVNVMEYDYDTDVYSVMETLYESPVLEALNALKITLDLTTEMPYVMVRYTRDNGETREQYIYKSPSEDKYWLLERE